MHGGEGVGGCMGGGGWVGAWGGELVEFCREDTEEPAGHDHVVRQRSLFDISARIKKKEAKKQRRYNTLYLWKHKGQIGGRLKSQEVLNLY